MDTSAAGQLEGQAGAGPERVQTNRSVGWTAPAAGANAAPNSTTSDGIFQDRFEYRHETGA